MERRTAIRATLAATILAACIACAPSPSDKAGPVTANTVRTEPPRTTTTKPYAVPAVIDIAYVNRVLAGLDAAMGDTVRLIVQTRTIPREAYDRLRAIYGDDDWLQASIDGFQSGMRKNFRAYLPNPGNTVTTVDQLLAGSSMCIFARVNRDYSAVTGKSSPPETQWVALKPMTTAHDPIGYNPTTWAFVYDGYEDNRQTPPDPCAS